MKKVIFFIVFFHQNIFAMEEKEIKAVKKIKIVQSRIVSDEKNWCRNTCPVEVPYLRENKGPVCSHVRVKSTKNPEFRFFLELFADETILIVSPDSERHIDFSLLDVEKEEDFSSSSSNLLSFFYFLYQLLTYRIQN